MFIAIHKACGKPAFKMLSKPKRGQYASSDSVRDLDGNPIKPGSVRTCASCSRTIIARIDAFDWEEEGEKWE